MFAERAQDNLKEEQKNMALAVRIGNNSEDDAFKEYLSGEKKKPDSPDKIMQSMNKQG